MKPNRAISLFLVLLTARMCTLHNAALLFSPWTPLAYFWQDALAALVFALLDRTIHRDTVGWSMYGGAVFYIAVNVGVERVLYSPMTWSMLRAAGGPLADSAWGSLTPANLAAMALPVLAGIAGPALGVGYARRWAGSRPFKTSGATFLPIESRRRYRSKPVLILLAASMALAVAGPYATAKVDTAGRHRNAFGALWPARVPDAPPTTTGGWRKSPFETPPVDDLIAYRGIAAGRNVLVIILESTAAQYLRPYGADLDPMPNLSAAAPSAILFENAYAVYPESIKGLFSVLCSRYPAFYADARAYADVKCPSIAERLGAAGYRTALLHSGRFMFLGMNAIVEQRGFDVLEDAGAIDGNVESSFSVDEPATVDRLFSFIDTVPQGQRFFAMYMPAAGHHPYATPTPGPFKDDGGIGSYRNALHYGDASIGGLFDGLRRRGLDRNTLFVVFGDHGEAFGQHAGNFAHTMFVYNENVHVPYAIFAPGSPITPIRARRAASLIDTAPTILDLLGVPIPSEYQGSSLLDATPRMALFFTDYSLGWLGLVDGCWKALHETGSGRTKLFDLCQDPAETHDHADVEPGRAQIYRDRLEQWIAAQKVN